VLDERYDEDDLELLDVLVWLPSMLARVSPLSLPTKSPLERLLYLFDG